MSLCHSCMLSLTRSHKLQNEVKTFFALPAGGSTHSYEVASLDVSQYGNCSSGLKRSLNASLVQVIAGDIVSHAIVYQNRT